jgi:hypothetical protein
MNREPLTMFLYSDISGTLRGKGFPTRDLQKRLKSGVGWTPTNIMFTALGAIAPSQWGPSGDVLMMPDQLAEAISILATGCRRSIFFLATFSRQTARRGTVVHAPCCATPSRICAARLASLCA